jgi:hypothetical protein
LVGLLGSDVGSLVGLVGSDVGPFVGPLGSSVGSLVGSLGRSVGSEVGSGLGSVVCVSNTIVTYIYHDFLEMFNNSCRSDVL